VLTILATASPASADPGHLPGRSGSVGLEITSRWITAHRSLTRSLIGDLWQSGVFLRATTGTSAYASSARNALRDNDGGVKAFWTSVAGYQWVGAGRSIWIAAGASKSAFHDRDFGGGTTTGVAAGLRAEAGFFLVLATDWSLSAHAQAEGIDRAWAANLSLARRFGMVDVSLEAGGIGNRDFGEVRIGAGLSLQPIEAVSIKLAAGIGIGDQRRNPYATLTTNWSY